MTRAARGRVLPVCQLLALACRDAPAQIGLPFDGYSPFPSTLSAPEAG
jgi:hypothetical protein